jgi:hypothetical protein
MWAAARHTWPYRRGLAKVIVTRIHVGNEVDDLSAGIASMHREFVEAWYFERRKASNRAFEDWCARQVPPTGPPS